MQFFLIRHTRPLIEEGVCYGQLDVDAEDPTSCASRLRDLLPSDTSVIASPLQRTRRLAEALHAAPCFDARLMEINFGAWEGRRWDDIERTYPGRLDAWADDILHFTPPGGESAAMLRTRAVDCVRDSATTFNKEQIALITHSGVIRALLGHWLQLPLNEWSKLSLNFGGISLIEIRAGSTVLHYLNR